MTSRQMSYYYGQPLVHCYLLHAEWIGERAGRRDGDATRLNDELIRATLQAGHDAQNHLLHLAEVRGPAGDGETANKPAERHYLRGLTKPTQKVTSQ